MTKAVLSVIAILAFGSAQAQSYPTKPITLVVPLAVGSTADIVSRTVGAELAKNLGQPVIIDNRPGAGGTIAMTQVAKAPPDGYTIAFVSTGTQAINVGLYSKLGYDPVRDFAPIAIVGQVSNVMIVHPSNPAKTAQDVIAQAKTKQPGEFTFSSGGNGTSHHLSGALFNSMAGLNLTHVPYKGAPQGITAVMAGEVTMGFFNTPTVLTQIKDGKLKALAVTSLARSPFLPNLPTLDESGLKGYDVVTWFGFVAPAATPSAVVDRLHREMVAILNDPTVRQRLQNQGFELLAPLTPSEFGKLIASDVTKWAPIVKASGASVD